MSNTGVQWSIKYRIPYNANLHCEAIVEKVWNDYKNCSEVHVSVEGYYFEIVVKGRYQ